MNPVKITFTLLGVLFFAFVVRLLSLTSVGTSATATPWWVFLVYLAILFCGIMFVYTLIEERRKEMRQIEEEGNRVLSEYKQRRQTMKVQEM